MKSLEDLADMPPASGTLTETTELGQVMGNLDNDVIDEGTRLSSIDFNTRLTGDQIKHIMVIDELIRKGLYPDMGLTRMIKRLNVSLQGKGREEKVTIVAGERTQRSGTGLLSGLKGFFGPKV